MPRNHSESQLLQIGSKALSNVAGQFSKLGQTLAKPRAAAQPKAGSSSSHQQQQPRPSTAQITYSPSSSSLEIACVADEDACVRFSLGGSDADGSPAKNSLSSGAGGGAVVPGEYDSGDEETTSSAYEANSAVAGVADQTTSSRYNENAFLPSVGIVMAQAQQQQQQQPQPSAKRSADVCTMSISTVTEHVSIPAGMLDCGSPVRAPSPAPAIRVNDDELDGSSSSATAMTRADAQSFRHSSAEVRSDELQKGPLTPSASSSGLK